MILQFKKKNNNNRYVQRLVKFNVNIDEALEDKNQRNDKHTNEPISLCEN